jgi:hypothetical protein
LAQETDEANSFSKERTMKVSNNQKSEKTDDGVSRHTLNDWQRKDAAKNAREAKHRDADPKDAGKQAEG